jgi:hypothetical protein
MIPARIQALPVRLIVPALTAYDISGLTILGDESGWSNLSAAEKEN